MKANLKILKVGDSYLQKKKKTYFAVTTSKIQNIHLFAFCTLALPTLNFIFPSELLRP